MRSYVCSCVCVFYACLCVKCVYFVIVNDHEAVTVQWCKEMRQGKKEEGREGEGREM